MSQYIKRQAFFASSSQFYPYFSTYFKMKISKLPKHEGYVLCVFLYKHQTACKKGYNEQLRRKGNHASVGEQILHVQVVFKQCLILQTKNAWAANLVE
jgi:hypothetical protein